jgi:hypothetical protein
LSPFQNASSRLILVLWSEMIIERLTIADFMLCPHQRLQRRCMAAAKAALHAFAAMMSYLCPKAGDRIQMCSKVDNGSRPRTAKRVDEKNPPDRLGSPCRRHEVKVMHELCEKN